ncbi:MAG: hypothetical protein IAC69_00935 [Proteobacteria bacterium]|uniref:Uncharacterized protein n=1 Tax=Candidatus Enterousia avistercoris TaxID=2840788 RepID=A0A9D9DCP4_9PROT|nr:hypothetical protein [Candidatus Enterousia avistercoris]
MKFSLRDFLLKTIPYILSIAGGLTLFIITKDDVHDPNVTDLINNIAASLLSIPLVFLLYDYTNYRVSKQLKKTLTDSVGDKINVILLRVVIVIRGIIGMRKKLTFMTLNNMSDISISRISSRLKITPLALSELHGLHDQLYDFIYHGANTNVLSVDQIQSLSGLLHEISQLINEHEFRRNRRIAAKYIKNIMGHIADWMDSDAFASLHFDELLGTAQLNGTVNSRH